MKSYQALFQPQWYETRNWLQEENWKKKSLTDLWSWTTCYWTTMDQRTNKKKHQKIPEKSKELSTIPQDKNKKRHSDQNLWNAHSNKCLHLKENKKNHI